MGRSIPPKPIAEYRARAERCLLAARRATDLWVRTELISLAAHWARLAELVENTVPIGEVYERTLSDERRDQTA